MQFVNLKSEPSNSVPWSITNKDNKDRKRNSVESRIVAVHRLMQKQPPTPAKVKTETTKGTVQKPIKVDDIARETIKRKRGKATSVADEDSETIVINNELEANTDDKPLLKSNSSKTYGDEEVPRPKRG
ncbi:10422_t:CDS:1, partial [Paraglomus brasilianum]